MIAASSKSDIPVFGASALGSESLKKPATLSSDVMKEIKFILHGMLMDVVKLLNIVKKSVYIYLVL